MLQRLWYHAFFSVFHWMFCFDLWQLILFRYVKSRSDKQLLHGLKYRDTSLCKPQETSNGLPIVPCGLIAWSLFNDTYSFVRGTTAMNISRKNIAWKSDQDHKYGKHVYPFNFQNGSFIGGGKLDPNTPVSIWTIKKQMLYYIYNWFVCHP